MSAFTDQMAADAAIFTNPDEFGGLVEFNGQTDLAAAIEDVEYEPAKHGYDGYNIERKLMFVTEADLAALVTPNQQVTLNGEYWQVASVTTDDGMVEINLESNRS